MEALFHHPLYVPFRRRAEVKGHSVRASNRKNRKFHRVLHASSTPDALLAHFIFRIFFDRQKRNAHCEQNHILRPHSKTRTKRSGLKQFRLKSIKLFEFWFLTKDKTRTKRLQTKHFQRKSIKLFEF